MNRYLASMISIRDAYVRKSLRENFYHGVLLGLLRFREDWSISSNTESGDGFSDILITIPLARTGILIELKYADNNSLDACCATALRQIKNRRYDAVFEDNEITKVFRYGIAFRKKICRVVQA